MRKTKDQAGMVTAEAAVVLPTFVLLLALAASIVTTLGAQLKLVDAARESARAAARGDSEQAVVRVGRQAGPAGTRIEVRRQGSVIIVTTRTTTRPLALLPGLDLQARAVAQSEQP